MTNEERCVICDDIIPEGRMVCPRCEKGTQVKTCDKYCWNCIYFQNIYDTAQVCNYFLETGLQRGCPPGTGCNKKIKGKVKKK